MKAEILKFLRFVWNIKANRICLIVACLVFIVEWIGFKQLYPGPNIIFDSYFYVKTAVDNSNVGPWPLGYSKFIRLIGLFSHSANVLVTIQYFILVFCLLIFFFTILFLFSLEKRFAILLLGIILINPMNVYLSNLILSDILFVCFSLLWLTNLLWMIHYPNYFCIVTNAIFVFLCLSVRYNALYYPVISAIAFIITRAGFRYYLSGIGLQVAVIGAFMLFISLEMQKNYGVYQFSAFGSWKLANNALYVYENVYSSEKRSIPPKFKPLDDIVREYYDSKHRKINILTKDPTSGSFYMWLSPSPLIQYMHKLYGYDPYILNFPKYTLVAPLYNEYGSYIIKNHPFAFAKYFMIPNTLRYFHPPPEVLTDTFDAFTLRTDYLGEPTMKWFGLHSLKTPRASIKLRYVIFSGYPAFSTFLQILCTVASFTIAFLFATRRINQPLQHRRCLLILAFLWIIDFCFSVLTAAVVLRYQLFILTVGATFIVVILQKFFFEEEQPNPKIENS